MMTRICRMAQRLDDHWMGDLIGSICLFGSGYGALLIGWGAGLK